MKLKIVAFLQNPWFKRTLSPRELDLFTHNQIFHQKVLLLSRTGKLLHQAFGDMFYEIYWDNVNPTPTTTSAGTMPPDVEHIRRVLLDQSPDVVLTFGRQARDGLARFTVNSKLMHCHHPTARGTKAEGLMSFARVVQDYVALAADEKTRDEMDLTPIEEGCPHRAKFLL